MLVGTGSLLLTPVPSSPGTAAAVIAVFVVTDVEVLMLLLLSWRINPRPHTARGRRVLFSSNDVPVVEATAATTLVVVENGKPDDVEWDDIVVGIEPKKLVGMVGVEVLKVSSNFVLGKVNTTGASTLVAFPKCFPAFPLLLVVGMDLEEGLGGLG